MGSSFQAFEIARHYYYYKNMKLVALTTLALVCLASAAPQQRSAVQQKALGVAQQGVNKGTALLQRLVRQYNIKGANGQPLNVRAKLAEGKAAAQAEFNSAEVQQQVADSKAQGEAYQQQAEAQLQQLQQQFGNKNLNQIIDQVVAKAAQQSSNIQNSDAQAAVLSALQAVRREAKKAVRNESNLNGKTINQLKTAGQNAAKTFARQNNLPSNEQQALRQANQQLNQARSRIQQARLP